MAYYMETVAAADISRGILSSSPSPFRHGILCGGPVRARVGKVGLASAAGQPVPGTPVGGLTVRRYTLLDLLPRHGTFSSRAARMWCVLFLSVYFLFVFFARRNDIVRFLIDRHVHNIMRTRLARYIYDRYTLDGVRVVYTRSSLYAHYKRNIYIIIICV